MIGRSRDFNLPTATTHGGSDVDVEFEQIHSFPLTTMIRTISQGCRRVPRNINVRRAYANLAYNTTSQPTSGAVPTLDRKLDSIEERIQARRDVLGGNVESRSEEIHSTHSEVETPLEAPKAVKKGIMSILPGEDSRKSEVLFGLSGDYIISLLTTAFCTPATMA